MAARRNASTLYAPRPRLVRTQEGSGRSVGLAVAPGRRSAATGRPNERIARKAVVVVAPPKMVSRAPTTTKWSEPKRGWAYCTTAEAKVPSPEPAGAAVVEISVGRGGQPGVGARTSQPTKFGATQRNRTEFYCSRSPRSARPARQARAAGATLPFA